MSDDGIVEQVARALCADDNGKPPVLAADPNGWVAYVSKARVAIAEHKAALAEAGYVILPREPTPPQETFADEVARLNREIGQRQLRLQWLVCGDPSVRVHVPIAAPAEGGTEPPPPT